MESTSTTSAGGVDTITTGSGSDLMRVKVYKASERHLHEQPPPPPEGRLPRHRSDEEEAPPPAQAAE